MEFETEEFGKFRADLKNAVKEIEGKYNISINIDRINYGDTSFDCKLHVKKADIDADRIEWNRYCYQYGLRSEDYNAIITFEGKTFQLLEINTRKKGFRLSLL